MHVVVSLPESEASPWMALFADALPEATLDRHEPDRAPEAAARAADFVVAACPSRTLFAEQPAPRAVFTVSAGVAHVLRIENFPRSVPLVRVEDAGMGAQMIRYVLAAAMQFVLRMPTYRRQQRAAAWEQHPPRSPAQITAGVMGLGVIGGAVARALVAQGFVVRGHARTEKSIAGVRCYAGAAEFDAFLDGLDIVCGVLPHTPETAGLLNRATMSRLADGAHVVNVGRGSLLVDEDLVALLESGKLSGATLDVFREEPLPAGHPFWSRPEITVTPHVSGLTIPEETVAQVAAKIRMLERGLPVTGVVDVARGY
ncbi:MAG: glyoxylate/hydroxypyruvate reductase A [Burkholderiales bacterium]